MSAAELSVPFGCIVAIDTSQFWYRVCGVCERAVTFSAQGQLYHCSHCSGRSGIAPSKWAYRFLVSIASESNVMIGICFDRPAKILMGCSADELFDFAAVNPFSLENVAKILEGQLFHVVMRKSKSGNAQHMRINNIVPLASDFKPVIEHLRNLYGHDKDK